MSSTQTTNYIQIDDSEHEVLLQQTPLITEQEPSQKRKQRVEEEDTSPVGTEVGKITGATGSLQKQRRKGGSEERS